MSEWSMLTLVGADRPGIVAAVTRALFAAGCHLGEASMMRLGGNFTIMLMVSGGVSTAALTDALAPTVAAFGLRAHLDPVLGGLHQHQVPNFQVRVSGADRAGIVADVTGVLAELGFNILELESDVAGQSARPVYIMNIQGYSAQTLEALQDGLAGLAARGVAVAVSPVDLMIG